MTNQSNQSDPHISMAQVEWAHRRADFSEKLLNAELSLASEKALAAPNPRLASVAKTRAEERAAAFARHATMLRQLIG